MDEALFGIDAGNSCCRVTRFGPNGLELVAQCPSVVFIREDRIDVGERAITYGTRNPKQFVFDIKLMLGSSLTDEHMKRRREQWLFEVETMEDGEIAVSVMFGDKKRVYPVHELWGLVLKEATNIANGYLGKQITRVVLSYPWYWTRNHHTKALKVAGLEPVGFMDDITAAVRAYFYRQSVVDKGVAAEKILVCDIGSSHVSLSSMERSHKGYVCKDQICSPVSGQDFDDILIYQFMKAAKGVVLNERAKNRLRKECEKAKCLLSSCQSADICLDMGDDDITVTVSRKDFEKPVCEAIKDLVEQYMRKKKRQSFDQILCVGGGGNIPIIQEYFRKSFKCEVYHGLTYQEVIARGLLSPEKELVRKRLSMCPGIECSVEGTGYHIRLERGDRLPCERMGCWDVGHHLTGPLHIIFSSFEGIRLVDHEVKVPDAILQAVTGSRWQLHFTVVLDDEGKLMVTTAWYLRDDATIYEIADQLPSTQRSQNSRDQSEAGGKVGRGIHSNDRDKNDETPRLDRSAHRQDPSVTRQDPSAHRQDPSGPRQDRYATRLDPSGPRQDRYATRLDPSATGLDPSAHSQKRSKQDTKPPATEAPARTKNCNYW